MAYALPLAALLLVPPASAAALPAPPAGPVRAVEGNLVRSAALPRLDVRIAPDLVYLGRGQGFAMNDGAAFERFLFGEVADGRLVRAAIVHFEHFRAGREGSFDYPRFRMAALAGEEYLHQVWPMPESDLLAAPDLQALLAARGIAAGPDWLVGRYARAVDPARRHEVLIFYLEDEALAGRQVEELMPLWHPSGVAEPEARALEAAFIERARAALAVGG